jgi:Fe-S cluster assembly iron-binding protein IscA
MNERIKELALQAMTYVTHNPKANKHNSGDMFDEKFAELIVKECLSYMEDGDIDFAKFMIKKNFGVKE